MGRRTKISPQWQALASSYHTSSSRLGGGLVQSLASGSLSSSSFYARDCWLAQTGISGGNLLIPQFPGADSAATQHAAPGCCRGQNHPGFRARGRVPSHSARWESAGPLLELFSTAQNIYICSDENQRLTRTYLPFLLFVRVAPALRMPPGRASARLAPGSLFCAACQMKFIYCPCQPEHCTCHHFLWQNLSVLSHCYFSYPSQLFRDITAFWTAHTLT